MSALNSTMTDGYDVNAAPVVESAAPSPGYTISFLLKPDEYAPLKQQADYNGRTLDEQVRRFMQVALALRQPEAAADDASAPRPTNGQSRARSRKK